MKRPVVLEDEYNYPLHMTGYASTLGPEEDEGAEVVARLHAVVKEVTGRAVEPPAKPRIGFLP